MQQSILITWLSPLVLIWAVDGFSQCSDQPEEVVQGYFRDLSNGQLDHALEHIAEEDRAWINRQNRGNEIYSELLTEVYKRSCWEIVRIKTEARNSTVDVAFRTPNTGKILWH